MKIFKYYMNPEGREFVISQYIKRQEEGVLTKIIVTSADWLKPGEAEVAYGDAWITSWKLLTPNNKIKIIRKIFEYNITYNIAAR